MAADAKTALIILSIVAFLSIAALSLGDAPQTFASHNTITEDESYDEEFGDYTDWMSRYSSSLRRKIDRLDDDEVNALAIPILFGVNRDALTPNFGDPRGGGTRRHEGLDILAPKGTPIVSPTDAVVVRSGSGSSAGKYVYTANPGGETFVYMHLDDIADIESGDVLREGELIGFVGDTGNANGVSHLHFEIRENGPRDPYPRITLEYTLSEKMEFLTDMLDDIRDEDELAAFLVETFSGVFVEASGLKLELHEAIEEAIDESGLGGSLTEITRDLTIGDTGTDVIKLQSFLISLNLGPASAALARAGATGYFGSVTQDALIEYQRASSISPANGYFGPSTRLALNSKENAGDLTEGGGVLKEQPGLGLIATLITEDFTEGADGPEVQILQLFLILKQSGPAARELFAAGATGYFGPITSAAFSEYQHVHGILETGMYDDKTRSYIRTNE